MSPEILAQLAPTGVRRAGINLSNFLLVTDRDEHGSPAGVSPDMVRAVAERLGVPLRLVPFRSPGLVADAAGTDAWDIALIGAEPQRAETIAFTAAYAEIEATYLVPPGSPLGFNWSSQHLCALISAARQRPRQAFSTQASCAAGC